MPTTALCHKSPRLCASQTATQRRFGPSISRFASHKYRACAKRKKRGGWMKTFNKSQVSHANSESFPFSNERSKKFRSSGFVGARARLCMCATQFLINLYEFHSFLISALKSQTHERVRCAGPTRLPHFHQVEGRLSICQVGHRKQCD